MPDAVRDRILEGGAAALRTLGFEGFSMEAVAGLAGVSRKTLYNHFNGKFALLDAIIAKAVERIISGLAEIAEDSSLDFVSKLNLIVERGFREARDGSRYLRSTVGHNQNAESARLYREIRGRLQGFILGIMKEAAAHRILRDGIDPQRITYVIINMVEGLLYLEDTLDEPYTRLHVLEESLRVVLTGVLSQAGEEALRDSPLLSGSGGLV